jgi:hypothetical protein
VELSANDHSSLSVGGVLVASEIQLDQAAAAPPAPSPESTPWVGAAPAPLLVAHADPAGEWNLELSAPGFTWAPEHASGLHMAGEGHAELVIGGGRAVPMYGPWHYLTRLMPGHHEVAVTLVANDHRRYTAGGAPIAVSVMLDVPAAGAGGAGHHH